MPQRKYKHNNDVCQFPMKLFNKIGSIRDSSII